MNASNSPAVTTTPVGLLGEHTIITRVRSLTAAAIASRSWPWSGRFGTRTLVAPATVTRPGYASKERHEYTTSSPGPAAAAMNWASSDTEPAPTSTSSAVTPNRSASRSRRTRAVASG